ncbi:hypothetical protein B0H10DRAFT_2043033 [Mycena sp. CBHHK59/15]|nr:hypothetical protein B0H10DRAFT_2043033 [Mycena sp. CBHHK59/15]
MGVPVITNITTNILLCMRLHALYGRSRKVLMFLCFIFLGSLFAEFYMCVQYGINSAKGPGTVLPPPIPGCIPTSIPIGFPAVIAWGPTVSAQVIFFLMSLYHLFRSRAAETEDEISGWRILFYVQHKTPLIIWFVRDGAFFFFMILVSLIVGLVIMIHDTSLTSLAVCFIMATYSFAGTRLILNLRQNASNGLVGATWDDTLELQTRSIMFAASRQGEGEGEDDSELYGSVTTSNI